MYTPDSGILWCFIDPVIYLFFVVLNPHSQRANCTSVADVLLCFISDGF